jgi:hypothetical protein
VIVVFLIAGWALLAPRERVLGSGIRIVYLHVATTWAGLAGLYLAGLLGAVLATRPRRMLELWLQSVSWTGLGLFAAGFLLSLLAAKISWGGILWGEPRVMASLRVVGLGIIVQAIIAAPVNRRLKGLLWTALATYTAWALRTAELFFHPEQPISESPSLEIKASFYGLFVMTLAAGLMVVWLVHPTTSQGDRPS